ncbi:MAG: effector binding domain-containing protein, partial [Herbinix sp.]|nr:effector binding domain-containing protein [Herbinix sp.]
FAMVGYSVKEYIRLRRISDAATQLRNSGASIIDVAVKYDFDSRDSFSRAFKKITRFLPSEYRQQSSVYQFERVNIMEKFYDKQQDGELLEKYPDIRVLKTLEPMKVAYYNYYGRNPEDGAFKVINEWLQDSGLNIEKDGVRIFGYNKPDVMEQGQEEYGYEVCVTIGGNITIKDKRIKTKTLPGGLYAVTGVRRNKGTELGYEIMKAWQRFSSWIMDSKYVAGGHQWLEEHLGFDEEFHHVGGVDLYMPIMERSEVDTSKSFTEVGPMWTASYQAEGKDAIEEGRDYFFKWAETEGLFEDGKKHRFFAYYNQEKMGTKDFFYKINVTVDQEFAPKDKNIKLEQFSGGYYAVMKSQYRYNSGAWGEFISWITNNSEYEFGNWWFFEEYLLDKPKIEMDTDMVLYMPAKKRVK